MNIKYHKIEGLYAREESTMRLLNGVFRNPAVEYLKDNEWIFTEKIDGMNTRVYWDGHRVSFAGRTDRAVMPYELYERLQSLFGGEATEQMFEQLFGEKEVILYGEGYGRKIQKGGAYIPYGVDFILFDVMINGRFLERANVVDIANALGVNCVPEVFVGTIDEAVAFVKARPDSTIGTAKMEGLVGVPRINLYDRHGHRIIVKIKVSDMEELEAK